MNTDVYSVPPARTHAPSSTDVGRFVAAYRFSRRTTCVGIVLALQLCYINSNAGASPFTPVRSEDVSRIFRDFLEHPPWIKKIIYGRSGDEFIIVEKGEKGRRHSGVAWFEAALQPSTCYLKQLSNSVAAGHNLAGSGSILGRAGNLFWVLGADRSELVFSHAEQDSGRLSQSLAKSVETGMDEVRSILRLGIMHLQPDTLRWESPTAFVAESVGGRGHIRGTIVRHETGMPTRLEYAVERVPQQRFVVRYSYAVGRAFPPSEVSLAVIKDGEETPWSREFISELEVGELDAGFEGFRPSLFAPNLTDSLRTLRFISNGIVHSLKPDGRIIALGGGSVPNFAALDSSPPAGIRIIFYALVLLLCMTGAWYARRCRRADRSV